MPTTDKLNRTCAAAKLMLTEAATPAAKTRPPTRVSGEGSPAFASEQCAHACRASPAPAKKIDGLPGLHPVRSVLQAHAATPHAEILSKHPGAVLTEHRVESCMLHSVQHVLDIVELHSTS